MSVKKKPFLSQLIVVDRLMIPPKQKDVLHTAFSDFIYLTNAEKLPIL